MNNIITEHELCISQKDKTIKILKEALEFYRDNSEKSTNEREYFIDDYVSDLRAIEALKQVENNK